MIAWQETDIIDGKVAVRPCAMIWARGYAPDGAHAQVCRMQAPHRGNFRVYAIDSENPLGEARERIAAIAKAEGREA